MSDKSSPPAPPRGVRESPTVACPPLVVLRECETAESIDQAIRRVRRETPDARILVVGGDDDGGDIGANGPILRPRPAERSAPQDAATNALARIEDAVQRIGAQWLQSEQMMAPWMREGKALAMEMERALGKRDLIGLTAHVRRLLEIHAWMEATAVDSIYRARKASQGMESQNTAALIRDAAGAVHGAHAGIELHLPAVTGSPPVMGRVGGLCEAFRLALEAVARRVGVGGQIHVEIEEGELFLLHRFRGTATGAVGDVPTYLVQRLRQLVVDEHGGGLFPGPQGDRGCELVVGLPLRQVPDPLLW